MTQQQFISECGKSYPEVISAVAQFRQVVQKQCKVVVERRIEEFAEILGVSHKDLECSAYANPDKPTPNSSEDTYLGQQAKRLRNLWLGFFLRWLTKAGEDSAPLGVGISIWITNASKPRELATKLDRHSEDPAFKGEPWKRRPGIESYGFWIDIGDGDLPLFDEKLDQLFDHTIKFLKSVPGVKDYFKP